MMVRRRSVWLLLLWWCLVMLALTNISVVTAQYYNDNTDMDDETTGHVNDDEYMDYVKEVLEEDTANHYHQENQYHHEDEYYDRQKAQQEEAERRKQEEEERKIQEAADMIAAERERAFQAELDRMNVEQQKAALKQKKKDTKMVRSILNASKHKDLYKVLGLRSWNWKIPARTIGFAGISFQIPGITVIKEVTLKDIRKAYRLRAMAVHPDKNKDGRAQEAFIAVEESASILSDNALREQYDKELQQYRRERWQSQLELVSGLFNTFQSTLVGTLKALRMILGPFATPVIIIGLLIA